MLYKSERERLEAGFMRRPLDTSKAFSYFGLMLGTLPPMAIFAKFLSNSPEFRAEQFWILGVILIINAVTAVVGYFSGKIVGKMIRDLENYSWLSMLLILPFLGIFWGVTAGGAGGAIVVLIGALFGAIFGAMVGGAAVPVFTIFHRLLKKGETIELKHFLPLAFGITFTICAFILGI